MSVPAEHRIFAVVLAAGMSQRFGSTKQLQKIDGVPMVRRAAALARAVCGEKSLLVAGFDHENIVAAAGTQCQFITINENYADGIGSSIACAARSLAPSADALLILLADQPKINEPHLNALLGAWSGDDDEIVVTSFADVQGPPVLLPRSSFPKLVELDGDTGAKKLLQDSDYQVKSVKFDEAAVDIDLPEDFNQLT